MRSRATCSELMMIATMTNITTRATSSGLSILNERTGGIKMYEAVPTERIMASSAGPNPARHAVNATAIKKNPKIPWLLKRGSKCEVAITHSTAATTVHMANR